MTPEASDPLDLLLAEASQSKKGLAQERLVKAERLLGELLRAGNVERFLHAAETLAEPAVNALGASWTELPPETRQNITAALGGTRLQDPKARGFAFRAAARIVESDPASALAQVRALAQVATEKGARVAKGSDAGDFRAAFLESGALARLDTSGEIAATARPILMLIVGAAFVRSKSGKLPLAIERQRETLDWLLSGGWWEKIPEREQRLVIDAIASWSPETRDALVGAHPSLPFSLPAPAPAPAAVASAVRMDQPAIPEEFVPMLDRLKSLWEGARRSIGDAKRREAEQETALRDLRVKLAETRRELEDEQARTALLRTELERAQTDAKAAQEEAARLTGELATAHGEIARLRELIPIERKRAVEAKLDEMSRDLAANYRDFLSGEGREMAVEDGIALRRHCQDLYERLRRHGLNLQ